MSKTTSIFGGIVNVALGVGLILAAIIMPSEWQRNWDTVKLAGWVKPMLVIVGICVLISGSRFIWKGLKRKEPLDELSQ